MRSSLDRRRTLKPKILVALLRESLRDPRLTACSPSLLLSLVYNVGEKGIEDVEEALSIFHVAAIPLNELEDADLVVRTRYASRDLIDNSNAHSTLFAPSSGVLATRPFEQIASLTPFAGIPPLLDHLFLPIKRQASHCARRQCVSCG